MYESDADDNEEKSNYTFANSQTGLTDKDGKLFGSTVLADIASNERGWLPPEFMNLTLKDKFKFLRDKFGDTTKGGVGAHINAMIDRYKLFYKDDVGDDNDYCDDDDDDGVIVVKR